MRVNVVGHIHAHHLRAELGVVLDLVARDDPGLQDFLLVINVVNEVVERGHALHQPGLHAFPLMRGNDAGNQVKRNQTLGAGAVFILVTVDGKGDAYATKNDFGLFPTGLHGAVVLPGQPLGIGFVMGPDFAAVVAFGQAAVHFVKFTHRVYSCPRG